jgi:hypothetical protein
MEAMMMMMERDEDLGEDDGDDEERLLTDQDGSSLEHQRDVQQDMGDHGQGDHHQSDDNHGDSKQADAKQIEESDGQTASSSSSPSSSSAFSTVLSSSKTSTSGSSTPTRPPWKRVTAFMQSPLSSSPALLTPSRPLSSAAQASSSSAFQRHSVSLPVRSMLLSTLTPKASLAMRHPTNPSSPTATAAVSLLNTEDDMLSPVRFAPSGLFFVFHLCFVMVSCFSVCFCS